MRFKEILGNGKLWSVVYEGDDVDVLSKTLSNWMDPAYLGLFFSENVDDLERYFHITNINTAIFDTIADAAALSCIILDIDPTANLDELFRPLENSRIREMLLSREKAKGKRQHGHPSWLRIYAIKLNPSIYLVTGGAIKLTATMSEREHTKVELQRMDRVRRYLIENGIVDADGILDYNS